MTSFDTKRAEFRRPPFFFIQKVATPNEEVHRSFFIRGKFFLSAILAECSSARAPTGLLWEVFRVKVGDFSGINHCSK